jgi:hypothetical protein
MLIIHLERISSCTFIIAMAPVKRGTAQDSDDSVPLRHRTTNSTVRQGRFVDGERAPYIAIEALRNLAKKHGALEMGEDVEVELHDELVRFLRK